VPVPTPAPAPERRGRARHHSCPPRTVRYLVRPSYHRLWGALCRLSPASAALLADRRPELGTPVLLDLPGAGGGRGRLARVESAEPSGPGRYLLCCRFARPLSHHGLAAIRREFDAAD
jgi:hypothetical protein